MIKLKSILLPTDFSECATDAARYAFALAEQFEAHLHLLHVIHDISTQVPDFGMGLAFPAYVENIPERIQKQEEAAIHNLSALTPDGWSKEYGVTIAVKHGQPFVEIIRYAREHDVDLIVIGTHGRTALSHALMGSVAERVVRKAPCPTLTVRPASHSFVMP
jgi:nucleotide-binding universal stress UspA family protein